MFILVILSMYFLSDMYKYSSKGRKISEYSNIEGICNLEIHGSDGLIPAQNINFCIQLSSVLFIKRF